MVIFLVFAFCICKNVPNRDPALIMRCFRFKFRFLRGKVPDSNHSFQSFSLARVLLYCLYGTSNKAQPRSYLPAVYRAARSPFQNYHNTRPTLFICWPRIFLIQPNQSHGCRRPNNNANQNALKRIRDPIMTSDFQVLNLDEGASCPFRIVPIPKTTAQSVNIPTTTTMARQPENWSC